MIIVPPESYIGTYENSFHSKVVIGKYTSIANGLKIIIASHPSVTDGTVSNYPFREKERLENYPKCSVGGKIVIGNDVWIGEYVNLVGELKIGDGAIIGAFSTVAKDVEPYSVVVGNPAKVIYQRFDDDCVNKLLKIKWWDWPKEKIISNLDNFIDIYKFIEKYE